MRQRKPIPYKLKSASTASKGLISSLKESSSVVLPILAFVAGTVITPVYEKLTFGGVAIQLPRDQFESSLDLETGAVRLSSFLRVANATTGAIIIEKIETDTIPLRSSDLRYAATRVEGTEYFDPSSDRRYFYNDGSGFPILIKPQSAMTFRFTLVLKPTSEVTAKVNEELYERYKATPVPLQITINGKTTRYSLAFQQPPEFRVLMPHLEPKKLTPQLEIPELVPRLSVPAK
jgi:hypothetical protein